jgi:hypothetical protein
MVKLPRWEAMSLRIGGQMRSRRTGLALAVLAVVAALSAAATPGGASEDPASVPEAAPAAAPAAEPLSAPAAPEPTAAPDALAEAGVRAARVTDRTSDWASFTLLDRKTGRQVGDDRAAQPTNSESTVKMWLAADLLATRAAQKRPLDADEQRRLAAMIRLSDDDAAAVFWRRLGGDASIARMIRVCGLTDTTVYPDWWSLTQISARDLTRMASCLVPGPGRFLSEQVGTPLWDLMRSVDGSNAFGIQQADPLGGGRRIAVKNGWTEHGGTGLWNVNCLGVWGPEDRWVLAVTLRYPIDRGLAYGADACRRVTTALFPLTRPD